MVVCGSTRPPTSGTYLGGDLLGPDQSISAASQGTQMCNPVLRTAALSQRFSAGAAFAPQGALGPVWRRFWLLQLRLGEWMVSRGRRSGMLLNKAPTGHSRPPPVPRPWLSGPWPKGLRKPGAHGGVTTPGHA